MLAVLPPVHQLGPSPGEGATGPQAIRVGVDPPYEAAKALLLGAVADANRCRTVWSQQYGFATVVGFPPDLRAVEILFTSLRVQATRTMASHGARCTSSGRSRTRSFRQAFLTSFAARIGERLAEVTHAAEGWHTGRAAAGRASLSAHQKPPEPKP